VGESYEIVDRIALYFAALLQLLLFAPAGRVRSGFRWVFSVSDSDDGHLHFESSR
jgi:hypothetical protein